MKRGSGLPAIIIGVLVVLIAGFGIFAVYTINKNRQSSPKIPFPGQNQLKNSDTDDSGLQLPTPSPGGNTEESTNQAQTAQSPSSGSTQYSQPQGLYSLQLPAGWVVNSTFATKSYSTTKFTGPSGSISITFGAGKDPAGGCSETSAITLADRTAPGCFLLQKDGSRILTRTYIKTKGNQQITVEAYINPPLATNQPKVVSVIGTIDIN